MHSGQAIDENPKKKAGLRLSQTGSDTASMAGKLIAQKLFT